MLTRARLATQGSASEAQDASHGVQEGAIDGRPPPAARLTRQDSRHAAARFDSMVSWENSDHPIAVWNRPHGGAGVDGVDVLTLSAQFVNEYLNDNLRAQLRGHGIDIGRDWAKLTNEEGIDKLRHAMGVGRQAPPRLQHGYVITGTRLRRGPSAILPLQSPLY